MPGPSSQEYWAHDPHCGPTTGCGLWGCCTISWRCDSRGCCTCFWHAWTVARRKGVTSPCQWTSPTHNETEIELVIISVFKTTKQTHTPWLSMTIYYDILFILIVQCRKKDGSSEVWPSVEKYLSFMGRYVLLRNVQSRQQYYLMFFGG